MTTAAPVGTFHLPETSGLLIMNDYVLKLLDRPIVFQRIFVEWAGSVNAALMLSQLVYWSRRTHDPDGWIYKTAKQWEEETGLTKEEQMSARKKLRLHQLVEEKVAKQNGNPTVHFRITEEFTKMVSRKTQLTKAGKPNNHSYDTSYHTHQTKITNSGGKDSLRSPLGPSTDGVGIFSNGKELDPFIKKVVRQLEDHVRSARKLNGKRFQRNKWYHDISLLLQDIEDDRPRLTKVLNKFLTLPHPKYTPQVESAAAFREKFTKLEICFFGPIKPPSPYDRIHSECVGHRIITEGLGPEEDED
jgi:hypothetical protein